MDAVAVGELSAKLRSLDSDASSLEMVANRVVRVLHHSLLDGPHTKRALALVRFYKTHRYADLPGSLQRYVDRVAHGTNGNPTSPGTRCLTLLGTVGDLPEWNARRSSMGHQAIPLGSEQVVAQLPMVAQLAHQFGVDVDVLLKPSRALILDRTQRTFNVFYVQKALGSPYIPAQKAFVERFNIRSVLGFGSTLPTGDLFAVIMFSRATIEPSIAQLFKPFAVSVKLALMPFVRNAVFEGD